MPKLTAAASFLSAAICLAGWMVSSRNPDLPSSTLLISAEISPLLFVSACVLLFVKDRLGYGLAMAAGLMALPVFVRTEISLAPWNSWIFLNFPLGELPLVLVLQVVLRILSPVLIIVAVAISSVRLLPERWVFRAVPLSRRTWPALFAVFIVIGTWFVRSVIPYSVPAYNHGERLEFRILHLQKSGLHFQETVVCGRRDGKLWVSRQHRRLFQYGFEGRLASIASTERSHSIWDRAQGLVQFPELRTVHATAAKPLWSWDAEGWYLVLKESRLVAFTSEDGTSPPPEVAALFHDIEKLPTAYETSYQVRDICLGFCYDPLAALGFSVLQRRRELTQ
jgi:hypothetical protein